MHVVGGQVGQRPAPVVLVLDAHHPGLARRQARVAAAAGLDAGLLVRADHKLPLAQPASVEDAGVEVQHHRRLGREVRVPGEDPRPVKPRPDGVRSQRPPDRRGRDKRHHAAQDQFPGQLGAAPTRQRHAGGGRQLAGQRFDLGVHRGGKRPGACRYAGSVLEALQALLEEPLTPTVHHLRAGIEPGRDIHIRQPLSRQQHDLGPHHLSVRSRVQRARRSSSRRSSAVKTISNGLTLPRATASLLTKRTQRRPHPLAAPLSNHINVVPRWTT